MVPRKLCCRGENLLEQTFGFAPWTEEMRGSAQMSEKLSKRAVQSLANGPLRTFPCLAIAASKLPETSTRGSLQHRPPARSALCADFGRPRWLPGGQRQLRMLPIAGTSSNSLVVPFSASNGLQQVSKPDVARVTPVVLMPPNLGRESAQVQRNRYIPQAVGSGPIEFQSQ
jgi:hypothetical protein